jgi:hypothetical protein
MTIKGLIVQDKGARTVGRMGSIQIEKDFVIFALNKLDCLNIACVVKLFYGCH